MAARLTLGRLPMQKLMPNQCPSNPAIGTLSASPLWNGWGVDASNSRFQPAKAAGLSADQVPNLKLKWAFGFPGAEIVGGQPTIAAGRVFIGVDTGAVYSLDAASGCVHWSFQADAAVRTAITIAPVKGQGAAKYAIYFGDLRANVYGVDATSGKLLWKVKVEDQPVARITAAQRHFMKIVCTFQYRPAEDRLPAGSSTTLSPCCTFRGSVVCVGYEHRQTNLEELRHSRRPQAHENYRNRCATGGVQLAALSTRSHRRLILSPMHLTSGQ